MPWRVIGLDYVKWHENGRRESSNCGQVNLKICGFDLDRGIPVRRRWYFLVAATVRGWHGHAAALTFHLLTAGAFNGSQIRVRKGASHRRSHKREQDCKHQCELAHRLHAISTLQRQSE